MHIASGLQFRVGYRSLVENGETDRWPAWRYLCVVNGGVQQVEEPDLRELTQAEVRKLTEVGDDDEN